MSDDAFHLETPVLLVAMPQVQDPFFHKSVVLLVHHQEEGSLGFIVNRPIGVPIPEVLEGLETPWCGAPGQLAHFGGPVQRQLGTVLYRADDPPATESQQMVSPDIHLTQNIRDLELLAAKPPPDVLLILGYAGWGEGQLMQEFLRHDWMTAPVSSELIFADDPGEIWTRALRSVGVDPAHLPSWSPSSDDDAAAN